MSDPKGNKQCIGPLFQSKQWQSSIYHSFKDFREHFGAMTNKLEIILYQQIRSIE